MNFLTCCVLSAVVGGPACLISAQPQSVELTTSRLRVGSAFSNITPNRELPNYNGSPLQPGNGSQFLLAHVIFCTDGETEAASISIDTTWVGRGVVLRIRDELPQRTGIVPDHVCIGATHAHHTPCRGP